MKKQKNLEEIYNILCQGMKLPDPDCLEIFDKNIEDFGRDKLKVETLSDNSFTTYQVGLETIGIHTEILDDVKLLTKIAYWLNGEEIHLNTIEATIFYPDSH